MHPKETPRPRAPTAVGLYLAAVQFLFALGWVIYAVYLPQLAKAVGLDTTWVPWLLVADQLVFLVTDLAAGLASDRAAHVLGRIGTAVLVATLLSALAFVALPLTASPAWFVALTLVWAVTSSALRAPPLTLLGRYVAKPAQPTMVALNALGLGVAGAVAPYLALKLKALDPTLPFVLSAASLAAVTLGIVAAERALARSGRARPDVAPAQRPAARNPAVAVFLCACAAAALAFQWHGFVASAPLALRFAPSAELPWLLPVFWVGFNLALWPAGLVVKRMEPLRGLLLGAVLAACGNGLASSAPALSLLLMGQLIAGAGWALLLCSAFSAALRLGEGGREGLLSGALSSTLAGAALLRIGVVAFVAPSAAAAVGLAPLAALGFALCALMVWPLVRARA